MKDYNRVAVRPIVKELRSLMPQRPLLEREAFAIAERQARHALELLEQTQPDVNLSWIMLLPKVEVQVAPRHTMGTLAGLTTFTHGKYFIMVNKNDSLAERRFTLVHELKHLLDYTSAPLIYRHLGHGDISRHAEIVEAVCDHFAACVLMPRIWVKRAWVGGFQTVPHLAELFNVSEEAMEQRLRALGFIDDGRRPVRTYFRREFAPA